jgi:hypothetical protein
MGFFDKIFNTIPLSYKTGYEDGFNQGLKFYKDSIDHFHKTVMSKPELRLKMNGKVSNVNIIECDRCETVGMIIYCPNCMKLQDNSEDIQLTKKNKFKVEV